MLTSCCSLIGSRSVALRVHGVAAVTPAHSKCCWDHSPWFSTTFGSISVSLSALRRLLPAVPLTHVL